MNSKFKDWLLSEIVLVALKLKDSKTKIDDVNLYTVKLDTLLQVQSKLEQLK